MEDLSAGAEGVTLAGEPVHAVIEQQGGSGVMPVFRAFKARRVNLFSGPTKRILADKRNMALVSEQADSADFTATERALIERHVAWTRWVLAVPNHLPRAPAAPSRRPARRPPRLRAEVEPAEKI